MNTVLQQAKSDDAFGKILGRLTTLASKDYYNPYEEFQWPETLPSDQFWMSRDLMSIYDTPKADEMPEDQQMELSRWESVNFYSLNVHGIRELLIEVIRRIHSPGFELPSEFFHHFVGEENEHMWFFAQFCLNYGKIYKDKKIQGGAFEEPDIQNFLVFMRILIFEEIVDFYNSRMASDESLHPIIRKINRIHHQDESRHIAFGRQIVQLLHARLKQEHSQARLAEVEDYIKRYFRSSIHSLYNPAVYRDAGIPDAFAFRNAVMQHPARRKHHDRVLKRTLDFLVKKAILSNPELPL